MEAAGDSLIVSDADAVTVYVNARQIIKMIIGIQNRETAEELHSRVEKAVEAAAAKSYESVKQITSAITAASFPEYS